MSIGGAWDSIILIAGYGAPDSNELPKSKRCKRSLPFMPNMIGTLLFILLSFDHAIPSMPPLGRHLTGQLLLLGATNIHTTEGISLLTIQVMAGGSSGFDLSSDRGSCAAASSWRPLPADIPSAKLPVMD